MAVQKETSVYQQIFSNLQQDKIAGPLSVKNTKSIEFSIVADSNADFNIRCIGSVQDDAPDPSLAMSDTNDYQYILFQDETASASYNGANPFNPNAFTGSVSKLFRFNTSNIKWAFIEVYDYTAGTLLVTNVLLSDNL